MNTEIQATKDRYSGTETPADIFVKQVYANLNDIKQSFFTIGYLLNEAYRKGYYSNLGYENISDCAEALFGFKKTTTYDLIAIYNDFHEHKAPMQIQKNVESFSQSQLIILTKVNWCRDTFIELAEPEDTIETFRKAKNLWNKIYSKGYSPKGNYTTLKKFIEINEPIYTSRPVLPAPPRETNEQNQNFIETTAVDTEPETPDQSQEQEDFSGQTEKLGEFCKESILHFLKIMDFSIGFGSDKKTPATRVVPDFMSEEVLRALGRAIEKDRTKVKHMLTKYLVDRFGTFEYEITLYGRKQNFAIFCGTLAGSLTDYLIKELKGKDEKK